MRTMNISQFTAALKNAAAQHGEKGVAHAKSLMLQDCMIVDESGAPIDPANIDVMVAPAAPAAEADMAKPEDGAKSDDAATVAKSVRAEIRAAIADAAPASRRAIVTSGSDDVLTKSFGRLKNFRDKSEAYRFGRFIFAACNHAKSADWCARNGVEVKAHSEGNNSAGGFLVPDEFNDTLISLREQYGVFRANAKVWPMGRDVLYIPRRTGTLTSYWVGETKAATESTQTFDNVQLMAKKLFALTTTSSELVEDAIVNIADNVAGEIAYEFALREDQAGFLGDGTSTYGGIVGLANAVGLAGTSDSGIGTAALSTISTADLQADIHGMMALLPGYAQTPNAKIYCHKSVFHAMFERVAMAAGGVTAAEMQNGIAPRFFGYPVVFTQVMSGVIGTGTDATPLAYFGDLSMGAAFGDRRAVTIKTSDSALNAFEQDEIVIRGTQRVDINCHSVGDSTNAGAVVMLTR
jgi:HK97 family phage major capsid protein